MNTHVGFHGGRFAETLSTRFTHIRTYIAVYPLVGNQRHLVAKVFTALVTLERPFARVQEHVVLQVQPSLEGFLALGTGKIANVLVERVDVGLQPTGLGKTFVAKLTLFHPCPPALQAHFTWLPSLHQPCVAPQQLVAWIARWTASVTP